MRRVISPGAAFMVVLAACLTVLVWILADGRIRSDREHAEAQATKDSQRLAMAYEEYVRRTIRGIDQALVFARQAYLRDGPRLDVRNLLQGEGVDTSVLQGLRVVDRHGDFVVGDRGGSTPYQAHSGARDDQLFIDMPRQDEEGDWSMTFSRRIASTDGLFSGAISVTLDPAILAAFFEQANLGERDAVHVIRTDASPVIRRIGDRNVYGDARVARVLQAAQHRAPSGHYLSSGRTDGTQRFTAYRRMAGDGLIVAVALSKPDALAEYEQQRARHLMVAALWTALIAISATIVVVSGARHRAANARLAQSEMRLRASEQQMHDISDALPVMIARFDADHRMSYHNLACKEWFALPPDDFQGRTHGELFPDDAGIERRLAEVFAGYPVHYQCALRDGRGRTRDLQVHYVPRYARVDGVERVCGYYALFTDISAFKRVDRMKNEFVSTVSHELRTPLTSIRGSLGLLAGGVAGELPGNAKGLVEIARTNCERLVRLISDILDVEKIESGKVSFDLQAVDMKALLEQAVAANEGFARQHGVSLRLAAPEGPTRALVDADRITQVVTNLLSNAVKFSPAGSSVDVTLRAEGDRLRVDVADHGPGIPLEFRGRIFQKFSQADASDTRQKGGSGLGLNISRSIVEHLGGTLDFTTELGRGTTFHFNLARLREAPVEAPVAPQPGERPRVLVCEDHADIARLITLMLQKAGYATDEAYSAAAARERLAGGGYVAMTLDIQLPGEDGISLLRSLRAAPATRALPVVVVSAVANENRIRLNNEALSVTDWLDKPIDESRLVESVRRATGAARGRPCILHVEDDPDIQRIAAAIARDFADFEFAASLREARERLADRRFDLVVLDLGLPDGDGWALVEELGEEATPPPVVVFSASDLGPSQAASVAAVLTKAQTSNEMLAETLQRALDKPCLPTLAKAA